jgi:esterase/lipase
LATALTLWPSALRFVSVTRHLPLIRRAALPKMAGSDIRDQEMRRLNGVAQGRAWMSLAAMASLVDFGRHVRAHLREVRTPALIAHARHDHTVPFTCLRLLTEGLGTPRADLRTLILERSHHGITLDVEREEVFRAVADHVLEYTRR